MNHQKLNFNQDRRDFLKKAGIGLITGIVLPTISAFPSILSDKNKKLGIALVGLGYYSTDLLAPALQQCKNVYLAGIVTGTPEKEKIWADKYGIKKENIYNYENFDDIKHNQEIDIIYVVLPNSMHKEYTIRAAHTGKEVICEKPMALNAMECREMIDACKKAGVSLSIGYRMQYEPNTQEVMRMGQDKIFGDLKLITAGAGFNNTNYGNWRLKKPMGGGAMMDMGVYSLQAARYVTGREPISVTAQTFKTRPEIFTEVDEVTTFQIEFPDNIVANLETGFHANFNFLKVQASKGFFGLEPFSSYNGIHGISSNGPINFPEINQQAAQMDEIAQRIKQGKSMRTPGEEGLRDMVVVDAIFKSLAQGGTVINL